MITAETCAEIQVLQEESNLNSTVENEQKLSSSVRCLSRSENARYEYEQQTNHETIVNESEQLGGDDKHCKLDSVHRDKKSSPISSQEKSSSSIQFIELDMNKFDDSSNTSQSLKLEHDTVNHLKLHSDVHNNIPTQHVDSDDSSSDVEIVQVTRPPVSTITAPAPGMQHSATSNSRKRSHSTLDQDESNPQTKGKAQCIRPNSSSTSFTGAPSSQETTAIMPAPQSTSLLRYDRIVGYIPKTHIRMLFPYFLTYRGSVTATWANLHTEKFLRGWSDSPLQSQYENQGAGTSTPNYNTINRRCYKLSLISQTEFTITGGKNWSTGGVETNLQGLRYHIKKIARENSAQGERAVFEKLDSAASVSSNGNNSTSASSSQDNNSINETGGGRWRIPLSAYQAFYTFLCSDPLNVVEAIPDSQLRIVTMARAVAQREGSTVSQLIQYGVPPRLAMALAPYQRYGVDFVLQRGGRALLADEMGLGKTIQSIAAMCCYSKEWPLLVLCPSSARYHWEAELLTWLGDSKKEETQTSNHENSSSLYVDGIGGDSIQKKESTTDRGCNAYCENTVNGESTQVSTNSSFQVLLPSEVHVVSSSKGPLLLNNKIRVVVCSYSLASRLALSGLIPEGKFRCIIADESHYLKSRTSQRTKSLMLTLQTSTRLILLSGTPALARPIELYPQIMAIGNMQLLWRNEDEYIQKYCKGPTQGGITGVNTNSKGEIDSLEKNENLVELHTLLTSTIMLRRHKCDTLKYLPPKFREHVPVNIRDPDLEQAITRGMQIISCGKGVLARLTKTIPDPSTVDSKIISITDDTDKEANKRVLHDSFGQAGLAKVPLLAELLKKWIEDPSKGKLCVFVHHLSVMNALIDQSGLTNNRGSPCKYIRIEGSTSPRDRQEQVVRFQSDPNTRIALLGITSAGVALTLTAASTIWFAELFWTPALLLQAEDRCHRIGQQSKVRCVYFVARRTLDELLWKLVEKKFGELGEFVEGKDNLNIIVHNYHKNEKNAIKTWFYGDDSDSFDANPLDGCTSILDTLTGDEDFIRYIEELGADEQETIIQNCYGEDDEANSAHPSNRKTIESESRKSVDLVCLLDDDETEKEAQSESSLPSSISDILRLYCDNQISMPEEFSMLESVAFPELRLYKFFMPPEYDFTSGLMLFCGRLINTKRYIDASGNVFRPHLGDIVLGYHGETLPLLETRELAHLFVSTIKSIERRQSCIQILFGEDKIFTSLLEEGSLRIRNRIDSARTG